MYYIVHQVRFGFLVTMQIRLVARILAWGAHHVHNFSDRQSVHPLKERWFLGQPFLPRRASYLAIDHTPNLWPVLLVILPLHTASQHASLHGPVDLHPARHDLLIHLPTHPTVPAGNQHSQ